MNEDQIRKFLESLPPDANRSISEFIKEIDAIRLLLGNLIFSGQNQRALEIFDEIFERFNRDEIEHCKPLMERFAIALIEVDRIDDALNAIEILIRNFEPYSFPDLLRTKIAYKQKDLKTGIECGERSLSFGDLSTYNKLWMYNVLTGFYRQIGELDKTIEFALKSVSEDISTESDPNMRETLFKFQIEDYENYLFASHSLKLPRQEFLDRAKRYNDFFRDIKPFKHEKKSRHKKLRIGYISPDLRLHVVSFFSAVLFECYDKSSFEVYCYINHDEDHVSAQLKSLVDHWLNIKNMPRKDVARKIYKDEIDILFDLSGHTADSVLPIMAYKPAPIQISGIGYFDTTGLSTIDYFLADKFLDPDGSNQQYFTEKLLLMEHSHFCFTWHENSVDYQPPAPCIRNGFVTFGSFNTFAKITREVIDAWKKILDQVPNSQLYLKIGGGDYVRKVVAEKLQAAGISIDRVRIEGHESNYHLRYAEMDIALDSFPYPGGGTSCDALYMGVPLITLVGDTHNSHFGYSFLKNIGLPELCAFSIDEYVAKAVELAQDIPRIRKYHQTIRRKMIQSPVMDRSIYISELESKYQQIYFDWLNDTPEKKSKALKKLDKKIAGIKNPDDLLPLLLQKNSCGEQTFDSLLQLGQLYLRDSTTAGQLHAVYWLKKALPLNHERPEVPTYLSISLWQTAEYVGAYEMISEAARRINARADHFDFNDDSMQKFYTHFAKHCTYTGRMEESAEHYIDAFNYAESIITKAEDISSYLITSHFLPISSSELFERHKLFQPIFDGIQKFETFGKHFEIRDGIQNGKMRIGYISSDFRQHVMFAFMYGVISTHDRSRFEIYAYSLCKREQEDYFTSLVESAVDHFVRLPGIFEQDHVSDSQALSNLHKIVKRIHDDEIDILFDFVGHTGENPLPIMAFKPAPVQISGVGYMATTALDTIDFFLTDEITDPPGEHDQFFTEKLLYMPSQFCYVGRNDLEPSTGAPCKSRGSILFGCFQRYGKITDEMLATWKKILDRVPNSRLRFKAQELIGASLGDQFADRLEKIGFDLDRIEIEPASREYMQEMLEIDIMLDTYPYPGGGTTCDTLFMGVPVVTMYGERRNTRFAYAILKAIGLEELAVTNREEYIERAAALAHDWDLLDVLHKNLRTMMQNSPIMNHRDFTRQLEQYYLAIGEALTN
ncbi:MAG: hypothetical protein IJ575_04900 [Selenomonadaceae bacterium]|nr:hypothetical protein [Selenomonadaceae bacterium]